MVFLITGKAGAGKTTYAYRMLKELTDAGVKAAVLDGDEWRSKCNNHDYSEAGRFRNLMGAAIEASKMESDGYVVLMSFVSPTRNWRDEMRSYWDQSKVVYIPGGSLWEGSVYEAPTIEELMS